ncbi:MAG: ATP-binding protein [Thermoplasmatota archaeon]
MLSSAASVDLSTCDREPIHVPGAIQPHGALLHLEQGSLRIQQVSANLESFVGLPVANAVGRSLAEVIGAGPAMQVARAMAAGAAHVNPLRLDLGNARYDGLLHDSGGASILELEPHVEIPGASASDLLHPALVRISACKGEASLMRMAVQELRRFTGFDRVMAYRFHRDGHGEVCAEETAQGLEPYLGLHYPASDIPQQARALYLLNWIRTIPDARYVPVPLLPLLRPDTGTPLDLSRSALRSVSPIHLEYMANMGLRASMSVSLIVQGQLWGMMSCGHEKGPLFLPHLQRSACELLGRLVSFQLETQRERSVREERQMLEPAIEALTSKGAATGEDPLGPLYGHPDALLAIAGATGAAVVDGRTAWTAGQAPPRAMVLRLAAHAEQAEVDGRYVTEALSTDFPPAASCSDTASGLATLSLRGLPRRRILWFRPEAARTVSWAGDPNKATTESNPGERLRPRRSFELWREEVRNQALPWSPGALAMVGLLHKHLLEAEFEQVRRNADLQAAEAQRLLEQNQFKTDFINAAAHELNTPLTPLRLVVTSLRHASDPESRARLLAMVDRNFQRLSKLVGQILETARLDAGGLHLRLGPLDLNALAQESVDDVRDLAAAQGVGLKPLKGGPVPAHGDPDYLRVALLNLLTSAIDSTPKDGKVEVRVAEAQGVATFEVEDTGRSFTPDEVLRLFQPFSDVGEDRGPMYGRGLGLYIAHRIMQEHGGSLDVLAAVGGAGKGGSVFRLRLPQAVPAPPTVTTPSPAVP